MFMVIGWPYSVHLWSRLWSAWIHKWPILWLPWFNDKIETGFFESIKKFLSAMWCIWRRCKPKQFPKLKLTCAFCRKQPCLFVFKTYSNYLRVSHSFSNYSGSFWTLFQFFPHFSSVFCHWSFSLLDFLSLWKNFFVFFCWIILGPVGGHVLVVGPVTWVHKTHELRAPKPQYNDLVFYRCRLHLQLTTMSDNLDFIKFHLLFFYNMGHIWFQDSHSLVHLW